MNAYVSRSRTFDGHAQNDEDETYRGKYGRLSSYLVRVGRVEEESTLSSVWRSEGDASMGEAQ